MDEETADKLLTRTVNTDHVLIGPTASICGKAVMSNNFYLQSNNNSGKPRTVTLVKGSGFRNRHCVMPVNRQTAIHLPRPTNVPIGKRPTMHANDPVNTRTKICVPNTHNVKNDAKFNTNKNEHTHVSNTERDNVLVSDTAGQQCTVHHNGPRGSTVQNNSSQISSDTIVSLFNTNCLQVKFLGQRDSNKTTANKWASLIKNPKAESTVRVKKPRLSPVLKNGSETPNLICKNNKSMIKTITSPTSRSNDSAETSNIHGTEHYHPVLNKHSDEKQQNSYPATIANVTLRDGHSKMVPSLLARKNRDMILDIALPSTSTCVDECSANMLKAVQTKIDIEQSNTTVNESDNLTGVITKVESEGFNVPFTSGLIKNKKRKKNKTGKSDITCLVNEQKYPGVKLSEISETKSSSNQRSKSLCDLESRYKVKSNNEEILYKDESDVISQVEAHKLSSVKDHRLLTLSEDEKAFLRSKSYLNDDATEDVKRRFGPTKNNNSIGKSTQRQSCELNKVPESTPKSKVGRKLKHGPSMSTSMKLQECDEKVPKIRQEHPQMLIPGEILQNNKANLGRTGYMSPQQPVIKLQRIDKQLQMTTSTTVDEQTKHEYTVHSPNQSNNKNNTNKVYYVINKDKLNQIKTPATTMSGKNTQREVKFYSTPRASSAIGHIIATQVNKTLSSDRNNLSQANGQNALTTRAKPSITKKKRTNKPIKRTLNSKVDGVIPEQHYGTPRSTDNQKTDSTGPNNKPLTVKDLLELKRKNTESQVKLFGNMTPPMPKQVVNMPLVFSGRAASGLPLNESVCVHESLTEGIPVTVLRPVEELQDSNTKPSSSNRPCSPATNLCQPEQPVTQQNSKRLINFANTPNTIPLSDAHRTMIAQIPELTTPSKLENRQVIPSDSYTNKKMHIKIGEGTMIVRNRPRSDVRNRKTLPAPKPKHKIADDYKRRKRRLSMSRKMIKANQRCLQAKLKKLLVKSEDSLHRLAQTLDLVPLDLLKQALSEYSTEIESKFQNKSKAQYDAKLMHIAGTNNDCLDTSNDMTEEHKREICVIPSADIANIIQIFRDVDGNFSYDKHHIQIKYRHYGMPAADHNTQSEFPCRIKFDENGKLQKISIETLRRGIYLINRRGLDPDVVRNTRVFNLTLVVYPPHAAVLPNGSISIAVGDIFSSAESDSYQCDLTCLNDLQEELQQFLWPFTMDNVDELIDRRYGSVTERSLSPRCCSPMFYTRAMECAFDRSANVVVSDSSSEDLTAEKNTLLKRPDNSVSGSDCQTIRFSERAMALKVKQNELFETCRKFKSQQGNSVEPKKKRRKVKKREDTRPRHSEQSVEDIQETDNEDQFVDVLVDPEVEIQT